MKRLVGLSLLAGLLACGGERADSGAPTEQDLYAAIARGEVRYVLLTRAESMAEARTGDRARIDVGGIEDVDALAAVLAKEHVEFHLQERRAASMPE